MRTTPPPTREQLNAELDQLGAAMRALELEDHQYFKQHGQHMPDLKLRQGPLVRQMFDNQAAYAAIVRRERKAAS
jgi:hypothetical protein